MGRKGIGKLSLFSIARNVEVHTKSNAEKHGFIMNADDIEDKIKDRNEAEYNPEPVDSRTIDLDVGTKIILTDMRRRLYRSSPALRRRLARRFSVIGEKNQFDIVLDGTPIMIEDRDYYDRLQYIWSYGERGREAQSTARNLEYSRG